MHPSADALPLLKEPIPEPDTTEDALMSLLMAVGRQLRQRQPGDQIDYSSIPILKLLSHQGPMRLSAVAHVLGLDASTVSRHARQLEDRGLLERTDDPEDRRASRVALSARGAACLIEGYESRRELLTRSLVDLSEQEQETLRLLLHRVTVALASQYDAQAVVTSPLIEPGPVLSR
jgi:DNA-binding MarR family transcriptional regulator